MNRRYWDSNAFLGWLNEEGDKLPSCRAVIKEAEAGGLKIVTSVLTIAEVLYLKRAESDLPTKEQAETIERFFEHEWILISALDRHISELGRRIVWEKGVKPKDAIHIATALDAQVEQFDTFDEELIKRAASYPVKVGKPDLPEALF